MNDNCLIISGGEFCSREFNEKEYGLIIACDRGLEYAKKYKIKPDIIIGDFDSAESLPDNGIPVLKYPTKKDDTDTMLAVKYALENGCNNIDITCAFGWRMDHAFANIQAGAYIADKGGIAALYGNGTKAVIFSGSRTVSFERIPGWSISVFSLSDCCHGVCVSGCSYNVSNASLSSAFPIGVSNNWTEDSAVIHCESGIIMVMNSELRSGEHI